MLPRYHILFGALFTLFVWAVLPSTSWLYLSLLFCSTFLMDFDHYIVGIKRTGTIRIGSIFEYHKEMLEKEKKLHKRGSREKGDFHLFHTIEFHALIALLGAFFSSFFFIFLGMLFHSMLDIISLSWQGRIYRREFFLSGWVLKWI